MTRAAPRRTAVATIGIGAVAALVVLPLLGALAREPGRVDLTIVNRTEYDVEVTVTGGRAGAALALGTARKRSTTEVGEVLDVGETWIFRLTAQGQDAGDVRTTRRQLEQDQWRIEFSPALGEALADRGVPPPP